MNRKLFGLTIFAAVFALVLGFNAYASDSYNYSYGEVNLFGVDEAGNRAGVMGDADRSGSDARFDTYGLHGTLRD